jgi:hypothetical protein
MVRTALVPAFPHHPDPDKPTDDEFRRTYRCPDCFEERAMTLMQDYREQLASGAQLQEPRCHQCGALMVLVGQPLDY